MASVLASLTHEHQQELSRAHALQVVYRKFIEDHGLVPPDISGTDALARFRHVFELAGFNDDLQARDLVDDWGLWPEERQAFRADAAH